MACFLKLYPQNNHLLRCYDERNYGSIAFSVKKVAQIRLLTPYKRLLRRFAKLAWVYIKYPGQTYTFDKSVVN